MLLLEKNRKKRISSRSKILIVKPQKKRNYLNNLVAKSTEEFEKKTGKSRLYNSITRPIKNDKRASTVEIM